MMLCAAPVLEPAHVGGAGARDLQAVDAEVVVVAGIAAFLAGLRALGHHQRPGNHRGRFAGPAGLNRKTIEVDIIAFQHHFLARCLGHRFRLHGHDGLHHRQGFYRVPPAFRGVGLAQESQGLADFAKLVRFPVHAPGDPLDGAEKVNQHRHTERRPVVVDDVFEQDRRAAFGKQAGLDFGHLQVGGNRLADTHQTAVLLQAVDKVSQGRKGHNASSLCIY